MKMILNKIMLSKILLSKIMLNKILFKKMLGKEIIGKKILSIFASLSTLLILTGCSLNLLEKAGDSVENTPYVNIGTCLIVDNTDTDLILLDNQSTLATDGLYYASWGIGNSEPYENSEGDTADLYDAQLYLLLKEAKDETDAENYMETWISAARENYEILEEKEISCNGNYLQIMYNCNGPDNPFQKGCSVFGVFERNAICIELTCRENFKQDLDTIITNFLNRCSYRED